MSNIRTMVFFATPIHDYNYFTEREATNMFEDLIAHID